MIFKNIVYNVLELVNYDFIWMICYIYILLEKNIKKLKYRFI